MEILLNLIYGFLISSIWITLSATIHKLIIIPDKNKTVNKSTKFSAIIIAHSFATIALLFVFIFAEDIFEHWGVNFKGQILLQLIIWTITMIISRSQIEYGKWFSLELIYKEQSQTDNKPILFNDSLFRRRTEVLNGKIVKKFDIEYIIIPIFFMIVYSFHVYPKLVIANRVYFLSSLFMLILSSFIIILYRFVSGHLKTRHDGHFFRAQNQPFS